MANKGILILNSAASADPGIEVRCKKLCAALNLGLDFREVGTADELTRWIEADSGNFAAMIISPANNDDYHSAAEAITRFNKPVVEVHLRNVFRDDTESSRPLPGPQGKMGLVCGFGVHSYLIAIKAIAERIQD